MYNFIFDDINISMGFFDRVRDSGIDISTRIINQLDIKPVSKNFYPLWSGCDNILDKSKVELINKGKMKLLLVSDGEALQEMTLNWVMDLIKKFNIDSKQVIFMSYDLRSNDTYRLLLGSIAITMMTEKSEVFVLMSVAGSQPTKQLIGTISSSTIR